MPGSGMLSGHDLTHPFDCDFGQGQAFDVRVQPDQAGPVLFVVKLAGCFVQIPQNDFLPDIRSLFLQF